MLWTASLVLLILKLTVVPALSWWIVAAPALVAVGIWVFVFMLAVLAAIFTFLVH